MSILTFPTLSTKADSSGYKIEMENPAIRSPMEGGYVFTRPRFTRNPRRTWTVKYTYISQADKDAMETFWNNVKGGSDIFQWYTSEENELVYVRFTEKLSFNYIGQGSNKRWNLNFTLEEA